jgi:ubiquinone biosynthesis protein
MLDPALKPTRLLDAADRPPIEVMKVSAPPRFVAARTAYKLLSWALRGVLFRILLKNAHVEQARRLRLLFNELGGIWIKVGQFLSLRRDLLSEELCQELSLLQDRAAGFPFDVVRRTVEAELQAPLAQIFDTFEEVPFATASLGQLHKAHLRHENVWVAVKVQRPFAAEAVTADLAFLSRVVGLLELFSIRRHARWRDGYWELEHIALEQIDYRFEASNIQRIRKTLRRHRIFVPKVFARYGSRRVLVMEFVEGALMADYLHLMETDPVRLAAWLAENNIDQRRVARQLCLSHLRQILEDNLYHGDLHPGNIVLLRDSRIALIDCGTVGFLDLEYLEKFRLFLQAIFDLDYDKAADMVFLLSASLPARNLEPAKEDLVRVLRAWGARTFVQQLPYQEKCAANAFEECNKVYLHYKCTFAWEVLRVLRAMATLDVSLMRLYPEVNYTALGRRYFHQAQLRTLRNLGTRESLKERLLNLAIATELPAKAAELAFFYTAIARRQAKVFEGTTSKIANLFAVIFANLTLLCFLSGLAIVLVLLERHAPAMLRPIMPDTLARMLQAAPMLESDVWLLLLAVAAYLGWTFEKLRQRFARSEIDRARSINV